jgi:rubrerythrin
MTEKETENKHNYTEGWVCPKCGYVWAWWVAGCSNCNQPKVFTAQTTTVSQGYFTIK